MIIKKILYYLFTTILSLLLLSASVYGANGSIDNEKLDHYFKDAFDKAHFPNVAVMIVSKEEIISRFAYGNVVNFDEQFIIGSSSKSITALGIMKLVEEGKINIDEPISTYLSENDAPKSVITTTTVRQLLNQTSGVQEYHLKDIGKLRNVGRFCYSNANFDLLGLIIQNVSHKSYSEYINKAIFEPMGMTHSMATSFDDQKLNLITGYKNVFGFNVAIKQKWKTDAIPSGYIASSPTDMATYIMMYLNDGFINGNRILEHNFLERMFTETKEIEKDNPLSGIVENGHYGFGWFVGELDGVKVYSHGGNVENYSTAMTIIPEKEIGIIILVSSDDTFAGQSLLNDINKDVVSYISSGYISSISSYNYWIPHLIINIISVALVIICIWTIFKINKWKKYKLIRQIVSTALLLFMPFIVIFGLRLAVNKPFDVILSFATDFAILLFLVCTLWFLIGLYKLLYLFGKKNKRNY